MERPKIPENEPERLLELYRYKVLDTEKEKDFDDLVELAAMICKTPISTITLIDTNRQWFKAQTGLGGKGNNRDISFCAHAINQDEIMIVENAKTDPRFADNPLVIGDPHIHFYAGVPLVSQRGYRLGTLCVIDRKPNALTQEQQFSLRALARQAMRLMELRLNMHDLNLAQQQLADSEMLFRSLAENAPIGIFKMDAKGMPVYVNQRWRDIAGLTEAEANDTNHRRSVVYEADQKKVYELWSEAVVNQNEFSFEFRIQNRVKGLLRVRSHATPLRNVAGKVIGFIGTIEDVTKQRHIEQNLLESERKYRLISANAKDVTVMMTAEAIPTYTFVTPSSKEVFGYEPEELIGKSPFDIIPEEDLAMIRSEVHPASLAGQTMMRQNRVVRKDGTIIWTEFVSGPAYDDDGKVMGIMATIRDITKMKDVTDQLSRKERLFRLLSENSQDIITLADSDRKLQYISPSVKDILGYEPEELLGRSILEMTHPEDLELALIKGEAIRANRMPWARVNMRILKKNKEYVWMEAQIKLFYDDHSKVPLVQASIRDITERKKLEEQLKAEKERAEDASIAKSQFLSVMSHEIRTPMNAIIGLTNLMMEDNPREDQIESLELLKFSGENLLVIINDILDFNKIEAGKVELETIAFNLKEILQHNVSLLRGRATSKGIELNLVVPDDLPTTVLGDPVRLGQVFNNLIGNAVKFTEKGFVELKVEMKENKGDLYCIRFAVKDSGIGIKQEQLQAVFELFTQASSDTTRKFGGTGLGLSITKKLLHLMDSDIHVQSEFGVGSEFSFELWLEKGNQDFLSAMVSPENGKENEKVHHVHVLLVEDNRVNQVVAGNFLKKWGMTVTYASNGSEACEIVQQKKFDIVLMDLQMPEMDGYEASMRIRAMKDTYYNSLPILALTASALADVGEKAKASGINGFITKPFQPIDLKEKILQFIPGKVKNNFKPTFDKYTQGDADMKRELAGLFINNLNELKAALQVSIKEKNSESFSKALHKAKTTLTILNDSDFSTASLEIDAALTRHENVNGERVLAFNQLANDLIHDLEKEVRLKV